MTGILELLLTKEVLVVIGAALLGLLVYRKGRSDAERKHEAQRAELERELNRSIKEAERKNKIVDIRRNKRVEKIRSVKSISDLLQLLREKFSGTSRDS